MEFLASKMKYLLIFCSLLFMFAMTPIWAAETGEGVEASKQTELGQTELRKLRHEAGIGLSLSNGPYLGAIIFTDLDFVPKAFWGFGFNTTLQVQVAIHDGYAARSNVGYYLPETAYELGLALGFRLSGPQFRYWMGLEGILRLRSGQYIQSSTRDRLSVSPADLGFGFRGKFSFYPSTHWGLFTNLGIRAITPVSESVKEGHSLAKEGTFYSSPGEARPLRLEFNIGIGLPWRGSIKKEN